MRNSWLLCVVIGTLAWGQAAPSAPPPAQAPASGAPATQAGAPPATQAAPPARGPVMPGAPTKPPAAPDTSAIPASAAVITINGICSSQPAAAKGTAAKPAAKKSTADCKTVITKAEFEKLASSLSPNVTPQMKKQLSTVLPTAIAMSNEAKKRGLDKTTQYQETLNFMKMQILKNELTRHIQDEAANVPQADIKKYYDQNPEAYEQYNLDRLFVPRTKQEPPETKEEREQDQKLSEDQQKAKEAAEKAKAEENEQAMTKLAETLRARAAAGEDFIKLQKEAFDAAGMKIESPTVNLPKVRRTGLPPTHSAVFDLKAGEVSQVINDAGGHYIYKLNSKDVLPLEQVKDEIHNTLQSQRNRDMMEKINNSFKVETNEAYFGPPQPMTPPSRMPRPRMAPNPNAPQAQPQTPPQAQPPAAKPD
jgi:peptidyl-prolyl cis-trans isomerase C